MLTPDQPAPEDYYQNNCRTLIEFVLNRYADVLPHPVRQSAQAFLAGSDDSQRLIARLLTRKGPLIRMDSLAYREIATLDQALEYLAATRLIDLNPMAPGDALLNMLRKDELVDIFSAHVVGLRSKAKSYLVNHLLSRFDDRAIAARVGSHVSWVTLGSTYVWTVLRLLYFGHREQDWSAFVLRDLGLVAYEPVSYSTRRHDDQHQLAHELSLRHYSGLTHRLNEAQDLATELRHRLTDPTSRQHDDRLQRRRRERALLRIGHWHERQHELQAALAVYHSLEVHPARERSARLLHKLKEHQPAQALLTEILASPRCEEERQFALRFGKRNAGYQPAMDVVYMDDVGPSVEQTALEWLVRNGGWGAHVENSLIRSLTGIAYWWAIFAEVDGAFTNPFQTAPVDLYEADFCSVRDAEISAVESMTDGQLQAHMHDIYNAKLGIANALVNWHTLTELGLDAIIEAIPSEQLRALMAYLVRNLSQQRTGFPDLFVVYGAGSYEFVEVKGPNDQLQPGQRVWLRRLAAMNIPARVLKLKIAGAA
jgi:hypothetical protein